MVPGERRPVAVDPLPPAEVVVRVEVTQETLAVPNGV